MKKRVRELVSLATPDGIRKVLKVVRNAKVRTSLLYGQKPYRDYWVPDSIHRIYVQDFIQRHSTDIRGHCLEFLCNEYARLGNASKLDIMHVDNSNPRATIVADLTKPNHVPSDTFDCIICTFVLLSVYELKPFIHELYRILAPNGVLLVTDLQTAPIYTEREELWRFTARGLRRCLNEAFEDGKIMVETAGNSLTTMCNLRGLRDYDIRRSDYYPNDPAFGSVVCARGLK